MCGLEGKGLRLWVFQCSGLVFPCCATSTPTWIIPPALQVSHSPLLSAPSTAGSHQPGGGHNFHRHCPTAAHAGIKAHLNSWTPQVPPCKTSWNCPWPVNANCGTKTEACFQSYKYLSSYCCHGICGIILWGVMCLSHQAVESMFCLPSPHSYPQFIAVPSAGVMEALWHFSWHEAEIINSDLSFRTLSAALLYLFPLIVSGCYENPFYIATRTWNHKWYRSGSWIYSFLVFIQPMAVAMWLSSSGKCLGIWECWIRWFLPDIFHTINMPLCMVWWTTPQNRMKGGKITCMF